MSDLDPATIDILSLMRRDPAKLRDQDYDAIVSEFRNGRKYFNLGNVKAGSTKPKDKKAKDEGNVQLSVKGMIDL